MREAFRTPSQQPLAPNAMDWSKISTWPQNDLSRQIDGPVHRWHVQQTGSGPLILLLHGAGSSSHSWRNLIPTLAQDHEVVALDLPGHGFTQLGGRQRSGLTEMTEDILSLCAQEGWQPDTIVGHSAGGAVALDISRQILSPRGQAPKVVGINAALSTFKGIAGFLFPAMAKVLAMMPFSAAMFSGTAASSERVQSLIGATGSKLATDDYRLYQRLISDTRHVDGTLQMMAQWDLSDFVKKLSQISADTLLLIGENDRTVPPQTSSDAALKMPNAQVVRISNLGHLAHEEDPAQFANLIKAHSST